VAQEVVAEVMVNVVVLPGFMGQAVLEIIMRQEAQSA
jgi:hypothetical protein